MKKHIVLLLTIILIFTVFSTLIGCGSDSASSSSLSSIQSSSSAVSSEAPSSQQASSKQTSSKKTTSSKKESTYSEAPLTEKEKILFGVEPTMYTTAMVNEGNMTRIANVMKKAQKGGTITVAVIGGSISSNAGASGSSSAYGNLVKTWWQDNFPKANISFVNAGFGATNSEMACYRVENDLLKYNPDFVVVDFAVNNSGNPRPSETYEALVNRILKSKNAPGVLSIYFASTIRDSYDKGVITQGSTDEANELAICKDYGIPAISYNKAVWQKIKDKKITWYDIGSDYIHPNDSGHLIAASLINTYLDKVKANLNSISTSAPAVRDIVGSTYTTAKCINQTNPGTELGNFYASLGKSVYTMGWEYFGDNGTNPLKIQINGAKKVRLFVSSPQGGEGNLSVAFNSSSATVLAKNYPNPAIVDVYEGAAASGTLTITPNMTSGSIYIYGIFIE